MRMFTHSSCYEKITIAERIERFKIMFPSTVEDSNPTKIELTTRATLRTVIALNLLVPVQEVIRRQQSLWISLIVQMLFFSLFWHTTKHYAWRLEKKIHELSLWLNDSRLF